MVKINELVAYRFSVDLKLPEILNRLNDAGPWRWTERDSEHYGDYISCLSGPDASKIKIFQEGDSYVLNIRYKSDTIGSETEWRALQSKLLKQILPSLGARDIKVTEGYS